MVSVRIKIKSTFCYNYFNALILVNIFFLGYKLICYQERKTVLNQYSTDSEGSHSFYILWKYFTVGQPELDTTCPEICLLRKFTDIRTGIL